VPRIREKITTMVDVGGAARSKGEQLQYVENKKRDTFFLYKKDAFYASRKLERILLTIFFWKEKIAFVKEGGKRGRVAGNLSRSR